ncbi:hypothetical protein BWI17_06340 [Betaproteobacteria bacterium GR16-43]|nr:hypothetical protein BWI17_06340 [Betaproteobacteria bacterium GR16-43]
MLALAKEPEPATKPIAIAIVVTDLAPLRSAPRDSAKSHALLWQGEPLEIRGEKLDYLQVYDHRLERGGFVSVKQVRRVALDSDSASDLLSILRFLRETAGSEALGIGYAAAYLRAASPEAIRGRDGAEALDALGTFADRLASRSQSAGPANQAVQATLAGHLEVAAQYGVAFTTFDRDSRMVLCYDGDAFRRLLGLATGDASQRARAVLALTRLECAPGTLSPTQRREADEVRAGLLDRVDVAGLPVYLRNRIHMRRAALWSGLAFQRARRGEPPQPAAIRALQELAFVTKEELTDDDRFVYADTAMRVNASRWAALPGAPVHSEKDTRPRLVSAAGQPGETCVFLIEGKRDVANPLAKRCTYGIVWEGSASLNRETNALAIAVQHTETWREMWVFRKVGGDWQVRTLPPAATTPGVGYAEFAGWVPGGKQVLVAREATGDGKYKGRTYELLRLDTLATVGQASDPSLLPAFQRWQDAAWKQNTVSVR